MDTTQALSLASPGSDCCTFRLTGVENEKFKRQERSNRTDEEQFARRFQDLEEQFGGPWSVLPADRAFSVAQPKKRSEDELEEAYTYFELAYKEACLMTVLCGRCFFHLMFC